MKKTGIFYGPTGGATEKVARMVLDELDDIDVDLLPIKDLTAAFINHYEVIFLGCSTLGAETWNGNHASSDWDRFRPEIDKLDVTNKTFILFGTGNQVSYPNNFVDAMGIIGKKLLAKGADIIGKCDVNGYQFEESEAIVDGQFIGLPIDENNESDMTKERITQWVKAIKEQIY